MNLIYNLQTLLQLLPHHHWSPAGRNQYVYQTIQTVYHRPPHYYLMILHLLHLLPLWCLKYHLHIKTTQNSPLLHP